VCLRLLVRSLEQKKKKREKRGAQKNITMHVVTPRLWKSPGKPFKRERGEGGGKTEDVLSFFVAMQCGNKDRGGKKEALAARAGSCCVCFLVS